MSIEEFKRELALAVYEYFVHQKGSGTGESMPDIPILVRNVVKLTNGSHAAYEYKPATIRVDPKLGIIIE